MNLFKKFLYWIPAIAWMAFIFSLSSEQRISVSQTYTVNFIVFKSLHMIEYGFLFFLLFIALYKTTKLSLNTIFLLAIVMAISYGISDEIHQTFTPTRQGSVRDVFIDTIGILLCFQYTKKYLPKFKKYL